MSKYQKDDDIIDAEFKVVSTEVIDEDSNESNDEQVKPDVELHGCLAWFVAFILVTLTFTLGIVIAFFPYILVIGLIVLAIILIYYLFVGLYYAIPYLFAIALVLVIIHFIRKRFDK